MQLVRAGQTTPTGGEEKRRETGTKEDGATNKITQGNTSTHLSIPGNRYR